MVILDTDHLSIFDQDTVEGFNLGRRLAALPEEEVFVTVITYEEQMRGWLTYASRANTPDQLVGHLPQNRTNSREGIWVDSP